MLYQSHCRPTIRKVPWAVYNVCQYFREILFFSFKFGSCFDAVVSKKRWLQQNLWYWKFPHTHTPMFMSMKMYFAVF